VLRQYNLFALFQFGAEYIQDRLCVYGFKTCIGLCSFPQQYFFLS
jgi:hypothetical protein